MSSPISRLKKASHKNSRGGVFGKAKIIKRNGVAQTDSPEINIALRGDAIEGGVGTDMVMLVGDSRTFKTNFLLLAGAAWQRKYPDSTFVFFDSENGATEDMLDNAGVDKERFFHIPVMNVEELHLESMAIFTKLDFAKDNIFVGVDSLGNLASVEEVTAGQDGVLKADAGRRAKAVTSWFRSITPYVKNFGIPMWIINHAYDGPGNSYSLNIGGGKKATFSPDIIWNITRSQIKDDTKSTDLVAGYSFNIRLEKSRYIKEKVKIPIIVTFDGGVMTHSGLMDIAMELGYMTKGLNAEGKEARGWFALVDPETGELGKNVRRGQTENPEFWKPVFENTDFNEAIKRKFKLDSKALIAAREILEAEEAEEENAEVDS